MDRETQPPLPLNAQYHQFRRAFRERQCLHPDAPTGCSGEVVRAHTVQRASLAAIARDSHVYGVVPDVAEVGRSGRVEPALIGLSNASTFTGFCGRHDTELFRPIENVAVRATRKHALLLAYRAMCFEVSRMKGQLAVGDLVRELDRGKRQLEQAFLQRLVQEREAVLQVDMERLDRQRKVCGALANDPDPAAVRFWAVRLSAPPDVMVSGVCSPLYDFHGNRIRRSSGELDPVTVSLLASGGAGIAVVAWVGDSEAPREFVASLDALNDGRIPDALVTLAFEHCENLYWSPRWWEGLPANTREVLAEKLQPYRAVQRRGPTYLQYRGARMVQWQLTERTRCW